eukprot:TRINITY_DN11373_c0_g1_i2.p1 TRINITY_DN11373_c0_g1~~TRINITY_DN11373_c0_g1_i2.p1  ORF type:complete len:110 (-),score=22.06 TRINITY_DN11373_c0_g1_i2:97-426(-)
MDADKKAKVIEAAVAKQKESAKKERTNLTVDISPEDSETDLEKVEKKIRAIELEGVKWLGATKVPIAYGLQRIRLLVEYGDETDGDTIQEAIEKIEGVQSTNIFAFTKA